MSTQHLSDVDMERMIMAGSTDMVVFDLDGTLADIEPYLHFLVQHEDSSQRLVWFSSTVLPGKPQDRCFSNVFSLRYERHRDCYSNFSFRRF